MSNLFSEEASTTGQQEKVQTSSAGETSHQEDFVAKVVAEKGEHWSDPSTLAKGYIHAQARIAELEKLEAEMSKRDYAKELLEQLQAQTQTPKSQGTVPEVTSANTSEAQKEAEQTTSTPENLQSLIEKTLSEREQKNTAKQNIALVEQKLDEMFGTEASTVVKSKASELGMSLAKLEELASEAPSAFMALVGGPNAKETNSLPKGSVNTNALAATNTSLSDRNWNYYNKMRKENPKVYRSEQIQKQMMEDRVRLGDKFSR